MAWERDDWVFIAVAPVALADDPCSRHNAMSFTDPILTSSNPVIFKKYLYTCISNFINNEE